MPANERGAAPRAALALLALLLVARSGVALAGGRPAKWREGRAAWSVLGPWLHCKALDDFRDEPRDDDDLYARPHVAARATADGLELLTWEAGSGREAYESSTSRHLARGGCDGFAHTIQGAKWSLVGGLSIEGLGAAGAPSLA